METKRTSRGFGIGYFEDKHNQKCSIQESSIAIEKRIWLGIDNPEVVIFDKDNAGESGIPTFLSIKSHSSNKIKNCLSFYLSLIGEQKIIKD